ncbi:MAG: DNA-binding response regulator [Dehalococcoidia bacterium]|nr:DNA-binding response regulator [Dehalococcoidia bacterium]
MSVMITSARAGQHVARQSVGSRHAHYRPPRHLRILLADDHTLVREGVRALLNAVGGFEVVGESAHADEVVPQVEALRPDVVLLDADMPGMSTVESIRAIKRRSAKTTRILLLATSAYEDYLFEFLRAGASGLILKNATSDELATALLEVHRNDFYVTSSVSHRILTQWQPGSSEDRAALRADPLTERERQLLDFVAGGHTNQQIARQLCISVKTVEAHKSHMVSKLGLRGSADLARYAIGRQWVMIAA